MKESGRRARMGWILAAAAVSALVLLVPLYLVIRALGAGPEAIQTLVGFVDLAIVVDIRRGSPHFGKWAGAELSENNRLCLFAEEGFAHGFLVLSDVADFQYKCSDFYSSEDERGLPWNDPTIGIDWPLLPGVETVLSAKDEAGVALADADLFT